MEMQGRNRTSASKICKVLSYPCREVALRQLLMRNNSICLLAIHRYVETCGLCYIRWIIILVCLLLQRKKKRKKILTKLHFVITSYSSSVGSYGFNPISVFVCVRMPPFFSFSFSPQCGRIDCDCHVRVTL